jgi:hypothetical protein
MRSARHAKDRRPAHPPMRLALPGALWEQPKTALEQSREQRFGPPRRAPLRQARAAVSSPLRQGRLAQALFAPDPFAPDRSAPVRLLLVPSALAFARSELRSPARAPLASASLVQILFERGWFAQRQSVLGPSVLAGFAQLFVLAPFAPAKTSGRNPRRTSKPKQEQLLPRTGHAGAMSCFSPPGRFCLTRPRLQYIVPQRVNATHASCTIAVLPGRGVQKPGVNAQRRARRSIPRPGLR